MMCLSITISQLDLTGQSDKSEWVPGFGFSRNIALTVHSMCLCCGPVACPTQRADLATGIVYGKTADQACAPEARHHL